MSSVFPGKDVPVVDPKTGIMNQVWYDYLQNHQKLAQLPDVSTVAPTNGQVLIYNSTTKLWTPGTN
jgi:uncharacterized protein YfaQ (DUF2300 family)